MTVTSLKLESFRNYQTLRAEFSPGVNIIYGENAQGKTNLLEAVEYLSGCRSHRARGDRELISFGAEGAAVHAAVESRGREFAVEIRLFRGSRRRLLVNGVGQKTAAGLSDVLHTVLFCPEDLALIKEGGSARRRFLDASICQLRPRYAAALAEYTRLYEHKTRILRDWPEKPSLLDTLDDFDARMAGAGAVIIHFRAHFIRKLTPFAASVQQEFSGGREELALIYETVKTVTDPLAPAGEIYLQLAEHQRTHRKDELDARVCLSGPHKDDLAVVIDGQPARQFASQGQTRTAALSLKLAERELHHEDTGQWPVLLLDDVLSELDSGRQNFVLSRIGGGQVFITCCEDDKLHRLEGGKTFHIHAGTILSGDYLQPGDQF